MPKAKTGGKNRNKVYTVPSAAKRKDLGVPKIQTQKLTGKSIKPPASINAVASTSRFQGETFQPPPEPTSFEPVDASLTVRDSSAKAFMRELRKVIERSDVIIQVLDARDPDGTRSKWVEEEVRKREGQGKKLLAVMNKIDLVPRANLEAWLRYLRHSFPCMPFKSSTQSQRQNLSQNAVPLAQPTTTPGQHAAALAPLPVTSSSLGAPALLHLLKQYALSTPHSSLTVGVVGYPNVGKSSLINSLKRSRACAVAAMPGKTRVVQEVVLDKGVKIMDCPGVVLEDFGREMEGEEGRRRQAEIMLRNCVKAELVEDPTAPVEVILSKVDPLLLQKLYSIPPYDDLRDFLIKIALTRGRLGKGGIPDLQGSAVSVLRDWNSGKIPYSTMPPAVHPSSAPQPQLNPDDEEMSGEQVGDAKILNTLSEAFTLDGLFDTAGDEAAWEGEEEAGEEAMLQDEDIVETLPAAVPAPALYAPYDDPDSPMSDSSSRGGIPPISTMTSRPSTIFTSISAPRTDARLFTAEELATLPAGVLDRQKLKQQAKKAKKKRLATAQTEGELMFGLLGMGMEEREPEPEVPIPRLSAKQLKKEKKRAAKARLAEKPSEMEVDEEAKKEAEFARFLSNMGGDGLDEEL